MPVDLIDRVHLGEFDARVLLSSSEELKSLVYLLAHCCTFT